MGEDGGYIECVAIYRHFHVPANSEALFPNARFSRAH